MSASTDTDNDEDVYVAQLHEVFNDCDIHGRGLLGRQELEDLCHKLQLQDQVRVLQQHCLDAKSVEQVNFEDFKEAFILVLSQAIESSSGDYGVETPPVVDTHDATSDDGSSLKDEIVPIEVSPKFIKGKKRYGRRSKPETPIQLPESDSDECPRQAKTLGGKISKLVSRGGSTVSSPSPREAENTPVGSPIPGRARSVLEGSGQLDAVLLNQSLEDIQPAAAPAIVQQLETVWNEVDVNRQGFLTKDELGQVCNQIGMLEMSAEELTQLFTKLDTNLDGRISFDDFLHGFLQNQANVPTCSSSPAGRGCVDVQAPSGSGNLSFLDPVGTGYAKSEDIVDVWEALGVRNADEVLSKLAPGSSHKINLQELSKSLERELLGAGDQSGSRHAACFTYHAELKHTKNLVEQLTAENDKLRLDIFEANTRAALIAEEVDDTQSRLENTNMSKIASLERNYQNHIKSVQSQMKHEREMLTMQADMERQSLLNELLEIKAEDAKLREQLAELQKENDRLSGECSDLVEQLGDLDRQNKKYCREVAEVAELRNTVAKLESSRDFLATEQFCAIRDRLLQLEQENKELRDTNDIFANENESLKQQLTAASKRRKYNKGRPASRTGSLLSEYVKPFVHNNQAPSSSTDDNEEDASPRPTRTRRRPLQARRTSETTRDSDDSRQDTRRQNQGKDIGEFQSHSGINELDGAKMVHIDRNQLLSQYEDEKQQLISQFLNEKTELIRQYENEKNAMIVQQQNESMKLISQLEEERRALISVHDEEKKNILNKLEMENRELRSKQEADMDAALEMQRINIQGQLQGAFAEELESVNQHHESELKDLQSKHDEAKSSLEQMLRSRYENQQEAKLNELKNSLSALHENDKQELIQQKLEAELKLKLVEEEHELMLDQLQKKWTTKQQTYQSEINDLKLRLQTLQTRLKETESKQEELLKQGVAGLSGKLRHDFDELLRNEKCGFESQMEKEFQLKLDKEQSVLREKNESDLASLASQLTKEKRDIERNLRRQIEKLTEKCEILHLAGTLDQSLVHDQQGNVVCSQAAAQTCAHESEEIKQLKTALEKANNKIKVLEAAVTSSQLQHFHKQALPDVPSEDYYAQMKSMVIKLQTEHRQQLREKSSELQQLQERLKHTRNLLDEYVEKYKVQVTQAGHRDKLVKDLYLENAELVKALQITEERQKLAEKECYKLRDKCKSFELMLNEVCHSAVL